MRYKKKKRFRATNRQAVVITLIACMLAGIVIGAIAGVSGYDGVNESMTDYLHEFRYGSPEQMDVFRESALKYGKLFVFIWLLAFLPARGSLPVGGLLATLMLVFRGAAYGFSTAALICGYGLAGLICAGILYLPQSLLLVPAYIYTTYRCVDYTQKSGEIKPYLPVLVIGLAVSLIAGLIDAFIAPGLVRGMFT